MGSGVPDVLQLTTLSTSSSSVVQFDTLPQILDQQKNITSKCFMFNMVKGHHLLVRCCPPLFCNFKLFHIKAATSNLPIIQKEVDELLTKGAIKALTGGVGFYTKVLLVPKHTGGLQSILNLKQFQNYMHIPTSMVPTIRQVWQIIQIKGQLAPSKLFPLISKMLICIFLLLSATTVLYFVWQNTLYQWKVLPSGLVTAPKVFPSLTKPILFLY